MTVNPRPTGLVMDPRFLAHDTGEGHPENAGRLREVYDMLSGGDLLRHCRLVKARPCALATLELIHAPGYIRKIAATARQPFSSVAADMPVSAKSYLAARLAVGGLLQAVRVVWEGHLANAFALVRPPGHHAEAARAMGYCLFNNVAIAAMFARRELNVRRVLIVDWDVHHGNGTQHAFERDPSVLFFSSHQHPHYPGTGLFTETGLGPGEGYSVNLPLSKGYGDSEFVALYHRLLRPLALEFEPDLILVSAGFDLHPQDPLGGMCVTPDGFAALTRILMDIADQCCRGKLVLALEGGYRRDALRDSIRAVVAELTGRRQTDFHALQQQANPKKVQFVCQRCTTVHKPFWKCFAN
ncbi:MAG: histone deacetylase [Desulfobacteraceae bacterium]|nr:histone deacetylase [Desulfobacteraceae bacterium]